MYIFASFVIVFISYIYFYSVRNHDYWKQKNVKYIKPLPFFGSYLYKIYKMSTPVETLTKIYKAYPDEKFVGIFQGAKPGLVIRDPTLIKHITIIDFNNFTDRDLEYVSVDQNTVNLLHARGDKWRFLRQKLTPAFTIKQIHKMFPLITKSADKLQEFGDRIIRKDGIVDAYNMMSRFNIEFIAACGMGATIDIIMDENSHFFNLTSNTLKRSRWQMILIILQDILPKWLHAPYKCNVNPKTKKLFYNTVNNVCEKRNFEPSSNNDFIDFLLELRAQQKNKEPVEKNDLDCSLDVDVLNLENTNLIAAQVTMFFLADYETSSTASSVTLHHLAYYPEIQRNIQKQIDEVLSKHENKLCYEAVSEMTLLEMAFLEAMRVFPPAGLFSRKCLKKYTLPGTNVTIDPGVNIFFPVQALHLDEKYFPNPYEFKPERFTPEAINQRNKYVYMPFGLGKRMCIGSRLGTMQSMAGLAAVLCSFNVEPAPQSYRYPKVCRNSHFIQEFEGGVPLRLVKRARTTEPDVI